MATAKFQPRLVPMADALKAAMTKAGLSPADVGKAVGVAGQSVSGWRHARAGISEGMARKLARLLKVDAALLVRPGRHEPGRPAKVAPGPARRALILHEAAMSEPTTLPPAPPKPTPVLGMEALSDGTAHVWCKATLPHQQAAALFRLLMDFGLMTSSSDGDSGP